MRTPSILLALLCAVASAAVAECPPPQPQVAQPVDALDRLLNLGLSVRKSFVGTNDVNQPAAISFATASGGRTFYNMDIGIKHRGIDCMFGDPHSDPLSRPELLLSPTVEFHRSSVTTAEVNKLSAGVNSEYYPKKQIGQISPFIFLKTSVARDAQKHRTSGGASLSVSAKALEGNSGPGQDIRTPNGLLLGLYYPYIGVDYFHNLPVTTGLVRAPAVDATFASARLYIQWYPFNFTNKVSQFQVLVDASLRRRIGGDSSLPQTPGLVVADAIYFFDVKRRFGLGFEFEKGRNPQNNFQELRISSLNLKLKM
jgi:hypothetical protein